MKQVNVLYRNKPSEYYRQIMVENGGIMTTYQKDYNGDSACPINGKLYGLFFCGWTKGHGQLPPCNHGEGIYPGFFHAPKPLH
jgi:hypothetical protein